MNRRFSDVCLERLDESKIFDHRTVARIDAERDDHIETCRSILARLELQNPMNDGDKLELEAEFEAFRGYLTAFNGSERVISIENQIKAQGMDWCQTIRKIRDGVIALAEGTVEVERTFHYQSEVKTKKRNRLKPTQLSDRMKITFTAASNRLMIFSTGFGTGSKIWGRPDKQFRWPAGKNGTISQPWFVFII